jgi:cation transport protein ChaC
MMAHMTEFPRDKLSPLTPLSEEALARNMADTMADAPTTEDLWLFAYGSLIWSPCFAPAETRPGMLPGYRRAFNIWTIHTRGTPEQPGLGLGLEPGEACNGVLLRISPETRTQDLDAIWRREMYSNIYRPCWLPVECDDGARTALCFVTDESHPQYAAAMASEAAAPLIARAEGAFGPCRDYLYNLLQVLDSHGIEEPGLAALAALVRTHENN